MWYLPSKLGSSGKNSARTGNRQLRLRITGLTREAILCNSGRACSALGLPLRCVNESTRDIVLFSRMEVIAEQDAYY